MVSQGRGPQSGEVGQKQQDKSGRNRTFAANANANTAHQCSAPTLQPSLLLPIGGDNTAGILFMMETWLCNMHNMTHKLNL